jgi:hypothetical protein
MQTKLSLFLTFGLWLGCSISTRAANFSAEELKRRTIERRRGRGHHLGYAGG